MQHDFPIPDFKQPAAHTDLQQLPFEASSRTTLSNCEAEQQPLDLRAFTHKNVGLKEIPAKKNLLFGVLF